VDFSGPSTLRPCNPVTLCRVLRIEIQKLEDTSPSSSASRGCSSLSSPLLKLLNSIHSLTMTQNSLSSDLNNAGTKGFRAACSTIQHKLETLQSKATASALEESCMFAAFVYIDLVLRTPTETASTSEANRQVQQAMMGARTTGNLMTWISTTAAAAVGGSTSSQ
jgi:hypothetical protein